MAFKTGEYTGISGIDEIYQSLEILLLTQRRTLPGDPGFGTNIANYLANPDQNRALIVAEVLEAISRYEPRVKVAGVEVSPVGRVTIRIEEGAGEIFYELP